MEQIIINLNSKILIFCKPDPKLYPDPSTHEIAWDRNLMNFYGLTGAISTFIIFSVFFKLPFFVFIAIFSSATCGFLCFCIFRRSNPWIYSLSFALASFVCEWIALEKVRETVYYHIGHAFLSVTLVFTMTGSLWLTSVSVVLQIFLMVTRFKEKLAILLYDEEPEVFADKVVGNILIAIAILLVVNITLTKILEKKTIQLSKAKITLENALEQQKTFIFSFSHELRNPINSLLGNLQLVLQGGIFSPKAKEMLNTAKVCGEILLHNINNVLDTGKNEIRKLEINPTPTHLNELFQRTWGIYSELFRQKKLKSQLRIEKDLPPVVQIDSHKINQILLNLIGNSIKFTERGSVSVTVKWLNHSIVSDKCFEPIPYDETDEGLFEKEEHISTLNTSRFSESKPGFLGLNDNERMSNNITQTRPQQGMLKIIVKDTGTGMKKEALDKLFQKFSQVSESASQRQIGTGLGLFITNEICHIMNGEIRAYSKFGKGTTFVVCIPSTSVPLNAIQRIDSEAILQRLTSKNLKAIIADDSPFNVNLMCDYFAKFSASIVSVAYNGYDAFMKYKEHENVDIVILDIDMPILDGRKACDRIREYERENKLKPTVVILMSGNYDLEQIKEYVNSNKGHKADCFLRKPVSFSEFHLTVYRLFIQD